MISGVLAVVAMATVLSGCLRQEVTHTIYVGPSSVVWSAIERDVRSDHNVPADRLREEQDYTLAVGAGAHPIAKSLQRLGGRRVTTTWLRRERPYSVMTEGTFADARELVLAILRAAQAQGDVALTIEGCETRLGIRVDPQSPPGSTDDRALDGLVTDLAGYRFILTEGRFTAADGFLIEDDGAVAVPDPKKVPVDGILTLALTWANDNCHGSLAELAERQRPDFGQVKRNLGVSGRPRARREIVVNRNGRMR
jgi:hypothetical protein